jgi:hypothetical protein
MPAGVQRNSTVARLAKAVRNAERHGGGWVQILIHHVCRRCHRYSITEESLERLLRWLDGRRGVEVRTVAQLLDVGGPAIRVLPPAGGSPSVGGLTTFPVRIDAPAGVRRVRFFVDGRQVGVRNLGPWRLRWYGSRLRPGRHSVRALLEDNRGNAAISPQQVFVTQTPEPGRTGR